MGGENPRDVEGAEVQREENRMDGDCVVRFYRVRRHGENTPAGFDL